MAIDHKFPQGGHASAIAEVEKLAPMVPWKVNWRLKPASHVAVVADTNQKQRLILKWRSIKKASYQFLGEQEV